MCVQRQATDVIPSSECFHVFHSIFSRTQLSRPCSRSVCPFFSRTPCRGIIERLLTDLTIAFWSCGANLCLRSCVHTLPRFYRHRSRTFSVCKSCSRLEKTDTRGCRRDRSPCFWWRAWVRCPRDQENEKAGPVQSWLRYPRQACPRSGTLALFVSLETSEQD